MGAKCRANAGWLPGADPKQRDLCPDGRWPAAASGCCSRQRSSGRMRPESGHVSGTRAARKLSPRRTAQIHRCSTRSEEHAPERRAAALLDGGHDHKLAQAQVAALGNAPRGPVDAEDVGDLEGEARHLQRYVRGRGSRTAAARIDDVMVELPSTDETGCLVHQPST